MLAASSGGNGGSSYSSSVATTTSEPASITIECKLPNIVCFHHSKANYSTPDAKNYYEIFKVGNDYVHNDEAIEYKYNSSTGHYCRYGC